MNLKKFIAILAAYSLLAAQLPAVMLDNMNTTNDWSIIKDGSATCTIASVIGYQDNAIKATFDLSNGSWVQFLRNSFGTGNFSGGDSIALTYRGGGNQNNLELKMFDEDGDIFVASLNKATNTGESWTTIAVPFTSFSLWTDGDGNPFGNGTRNWDKIVKYNVNIIKSEGGTGYVELDTLSAWQESPPGTQLIDSCDTGNNYWGHGEWTGLDSAYPANSVTYSNPSTEPSPAGGKYYRMDYSRMDAGWVVGLSEDMTVAGSSFNATGYSYLNFYAKVGTLDEETDVEFWFFQPTKAGAETDLKSLNLSDYGTLSTGWKFYSIPLADFNFASKGMSGSYLKELKFSFRQGSAGTLFLDKLWLSTTQNEAETSGDKGALNTFSDEVNSLTYTVWGSSNGVITAKSVDGQSDKAMRLDYNFKGAEWLICEKGTGINAAVDKGFRFRYKGSGIPANIEFKVKDRNNVEFIKKFYAVTNTGGQWKTATILSKELTLFAKGTNNNESLDLKNLAQIGFALTRAGNSYGQGTLYVDSLETISERDFENLRPGKIISSLSIDNNPFSPNGDGVKDRATFAFTLSDYAHVWLDIYDMAGQVVKRIDVGDLIPDSYSDLQWDGKDGDGNTVNNGLYFYKLRARNPDNMSDHITELIMVLK